MKILLVALYDFYSNGIRGLHSFLAGKGYDVSSFYFKFSTYNEGMYVQPEVDALLNLIASDPPEFVGFGVRSPLFPAFSHLSREIRARFPDIKIIAGGPHATADPESCLPYAEYVVVGDGELPLLDILDGCDTGVLKPKRFTDLDSLPFKHYGNNTYTTCSEVKHSPKISAYTTRGCFFNCTYCQESVLKQAPVRKSVKYFKEELDYMKMVFPNMKWVTLSDSMFIYDMDYLEEFASAFSNSGIRFWCAGQSSVITDDMLKTIKAAGVEAVRIGVQSGSDRLRREVYNRKDSLDDILRVSELLVKHEINGHYDFIIESPYDTPETIAATRRFINKLPVSALTNKFELRYWPGTPLTERAINDGYIRRDEIEGNFLRFGDWTYLYHHVGMK